MNDMVDIKRIDVLQIHEIQAHALRTYLIDDCRDENDRAPVAIAVFQVMTELQFISAKEFNDWLTSNAIPNVQFQLFPLSYVVFYDMADVIMFKFCFVNTS